jgi:hypothetical protein
MYNRFLFDVFENISDIPNKFEKIENVVALGLKYRDWKKPELKSRDRKRPVLIPLLCPIQLIGSEPKLENIEEGAERVIPCILIPFSVFSLSFLLSHQYLLLLPLPSHFLPSPLFLS